MVVLVSGGELLFLSVAGCFEALLRNGYNFFIFLYRIIFQ